MDRIAIGIEALHPESARTTAIDTATVLFHVTQTTPLGGDRHFLWTVEAATPAGTSKRTIQRQQRLHAGPSWLLSDSWWKEAEFEFSAVVAAESAAERRVFTNIKNHRQLEELRIGKVAILLADRNGRDFILVLQFAAGDYFFQPLEVLTNRHGIECLEGVQSVA